MSTTKRRDESSKSLPIDETAENRIEEVLEETDFDEEYLEVYSVNHSLKDDCLNVSATRYETPGDEAEFRSWFDIDSETYSTFGDKSPEAGKIYIVRRKKSPESETSFMEYADQMLERDIEGESHEEILRSLCIQHNQRMKTRGRDEQTMGKMEYDQRLTEVLENYGGMNRRKLEPPRSQVDW